MGPEKANSKHQPENEGQPQGISGGKTKKVFISYGRLDTEIIAFRLLADLTEQGFEVWLDREQIRMGKSWEEQIEGAILSSDCFISLLSPHAVRRPDGVCLDEISMARYNNRKIIPVMIISCRPPLGIYRLDWLDLQNWENAHQYKRNLERLSTLIESDEQEVEGIHAAIFSLLKPIDFKIDIYRHTLNFTGREKLLKFIGTWADTSPGKVLVIYGNPGAGKTALMSKLIHVMPQVAAFHFCMSKLETSLIPEKFVTSIASQLATQIPEYRDILSHKNLPSMLCQETGMLVKQLLVEPLSQIVPQKPLVIIIDALDESLYRGNDSIARLLFDWMDDLPSWIKLVITSRNVPEISSLFDFHKTIEIIDNYEDNTADIVQYVHDSLSQNNIGFQMLLTCPDLVERVVTYSQGVFLYAKTIVQSILSETFGIEQIGNFPPGLGGIYLANFNRFFQKETDFEGYKPLLEIILASFKPLTVEELVGFEDCSRYEIMNLLRKLVEFFPENEGTYSAFHTSLEDWLAGRTSHSHPFVVDIRKGHSKIANALLKEAEQGSPSEYARQYLLKHLYYAKRVDDMQRNLNDISLIEIRAAHNEVYELIEDFKQFHSQQKKHVGAIGLNSANQIWDNDRNIYESQVLSSNMNQDLRTDMIYDFLYKNASLIQFYGMVPGFVRQQAFNSGLIPLVFGEDALQMGKGMPFLLEYGTGSGFDPFPAIRREFNSHFSGISALAVGKEARMLVSASFDKHVRLYRIQTGECLKNLSFGQNVEALAISTLDASIAIAGDIDNYDIVIYDEKLEKINSRLKGHTGTVKMMMTSKNNRLVSCGKDGNIFVWNFKDNTKLFRKTMAGVINVCAISGNGKIVSLASSENHVEVWNIESNSLIFQFHHEKGEIGALFLTNEGKELVIGGGKDALTEVWDLSLKSMLYKVTGHGSITQCLFVDETGSIMISGGKDPYLKVWDFRSGECIKQLESHPRVTRRLAVSDDLSTVVTGGGWNSDNKIRLWDIIRGKCVPENPANHGSAFAIVHANQDYLLLVYKRAILRQNFNTGNWKIVKDNLHIIHVERLNQILLVACSNGEVFKYHLLLETWEKFFHHQYQIETMLPLHNGTVLVGDVLGNILITGSAETLKLDFQATHKIRKLFTLIDCFVVLDYENRFTCIDSNGIHLFDYVHAERITSNVFPSEDGLYFGDAAGNLNQFSLGERSLRHHVHAHPVPVTSILYLKNLNRLISGCEDGTIRIWRGDLSQSTEIKAYTTPVVSLISSDGPTFISVSGFQRSENDPAGSFQDLALKKWNVFTGECLGVLPLDDKIIALDRDEKGSIVCLQRNGHILKFSQYKGK